MSDDPRLDEAAAALPRLEPPPALLASTLALVAETAQDPRPAEAAPPPAPSGANNTRWFVAAAVALAVAAAWLVVPRPAPVGDPERFVPRGDAPVPEIGLRMAVRQGEGVERFRRGEAYSAGDTLLFRYDSGEVGHAHLVRVDAGGAALLTVSSVGPGTGDLLTDGALLGYELEQGESAAVFALVLADQALPAGTVAQAFAVGVDPEGVCAVARDLGAGCDAVLVQAVP